MSWLTWTRVISTLVRCHITPVATLKKIAAASGRAPIEPGADICLLHEPTWLARQ